MDDNWQNQKVIAYDPELCTGCRYCEIVCSFKHYHTVDFNKSYLRILFSGDDGTGAFEAVHCQHCEEPMCVNACPPEALSKDEKTGWVTLNPLKCIGCQTCVHICPLSVPLFDEKLIVAAKCDFCDGDPECVKHCSSAALRVVTREEALRLNNELYVGAK